MAIASVTSLNATLLPISGPAMSVPPARNSSGVVRRPSDVFQQVAAIERFHQEGDCAISQCLLANVIVIMGRDEDDRQLMPFPSNPPLQFRPVHPGQTHVCDDARHARQRAGQQKRFRGFEGDGFVSGGFENALNRFSNTTIVVDGCDDEIATEASGRTFSMRLHGTHPRARMATIGLFRRSREAGSRACRRIGPARRGIARPSCA